MMKTKGVFATILAGIFFAYVLSGCAVEKPFDRTPVIISTEAELYKAILDAGKTNRIESPNRVYDLLEKNGIRNIQAYYKFATLPEGTQLMHISLMGNMVTYTYTSVEHPLTLTWYCDKYAYSLVSAVLADMDTTTLPGHYSRQYQIPVNDGSTHTVYYVVWSQEEYWFLAVFPAEIDTDTIIRTCKAIKIVVE